MKVKNRLLNFTDKYIYQNDDYFAFSLDSVLLANFVTIKLSDKNIIDFCSGNAPIPMLMSFRTKARIFGVELQKDIYDLGMESIVENQMNNQISLINGDVKNIEKFIDSESMDIVTCNPPYFKYQNDSLVNDNDIKTIARHEVKLNLNQLFVIAKKLLKNNGVIAVVHRPERLVEIIEEMKKNNIEPKKVQFVYPKKNMEANIMLIEGSKNGKPGLKILPPLYTHLDNGDYTEEVKQYFE